MRSNAKLKLASAAPFKIESGIAIPSRTKPNPYEGVFAKMRVNDSFLIDDPEQAKSVQYQAGRYRHDHKAVKFSFRQVNDGVRCWRVA